MKLFNRDDWLEQQIDDGTPLGVFEGLSTKDYDDSEALRRSNVNWLMRSGLYYKIKDEGERDEATAAMKFGTAVHTALLSPEEWNDLCCVGPAVSSRQTNKWKDFEAHPDNRGKICLHPKEMDLLDEMLKSIRSHDFAMSFLGQRNTLELTALVHLMGHYVKARGDSVVFNKGIIADLKTAASATPYEFQISSYKYKYDVQAAFYLDVFNAAMKVMEGEGPLKNGNWFDKFVFIVVEKEPPYDLMLYVADPSFIQAGRKKYQDALELLTTCKESNEYPGYPRKMFNLTLPRWAQNL